MHANRTRHGSGRPHVDERISTSQGSAPAKYTGWRYERVAFPSDLKGSVQLWPMDLDEGADAAIRVGTLNIAKMENSRHAAVGKVCLRRAADRDCCELREEMFE